MIQSIQSTAYSPAYYPTASVTTASTSMVPAQVYTADTYQSNQASNLDVNKQASLLKRLGNGIGNSFGRMADWVGLGTISHYAKDNFQAYDANRSNSLDIQEFSAVSQLIQRDFQQVDANQDQQLSFGEFKRVVGDLVDASFKAADTSGDGFLNYAEASTAGYVLINGAHNSFVGSDRNQDQLLSRNEFAALINDVKLRRR